MSRTVIFYKTADGKCPVQEFLDSLSGKVAQKVLKKTQKTPKQEIERAESYRKDFLNRRKKI
jgi:peptide methionine sulfoxide reductase MsrA